MNRLFLVLVIIALAQVSTLLTESVGTRALGSFSTVTTSPSVATSSLPIVAQPIVVPQRVTFTGDVMLARRVETMMHEHGSSYPFSNRSFASSTYVVGNFEASAPALHTPTPDFNYQFSVDPAFLAAARAAGFTHFSLANNHSEDYGYRGFEETKHALTDHNLAAFGGQTLASTSLTILNVNGVSVAIVGIYAVDIPVSVPTVVKLLSSLAASSTYQIAYIHWGVEYEPLHSEKQAELAHALVDAGFDAIIGHHPHVVEDIEWYHQAPIFYSLGNYIFDQYFSTAVMNGLTLTVTPTASGITFVLEPVTTLSTHSAPKLMTDEELTTFLSDVAAKSSSILRPEITKRQFTVGPNGLQLSQNELVLPP